jgi:hypothetical protein
MGPVSAYVAVSPKNQTAVRGASTGQTMIIVGKNNQEQAR